MTRPEIVKYEKKGRRVFPGTFRYNPKTGCSSLEENNVRGSSTSSDDYDSSIDNSKKEKKLPQNSNKHNKQPMCETSTTAPETNSEKYFSATNSREFFSAEGSDNFSSNSAKNKNETPSTTPSNNNAKQPKDKPDKPFNKITMSL